MKRMKFKWIRFQTLSRMLILILSLTICLSAKSTVKTIGKLSQENPGSALQPNDTSKTVLFITTPPGASLFIDGTLYGPTPIRITVTHGHHIILFRYQYLRIFDEIFINDSTDKLEFQLIPSTPKPPYNTKNQPPTIGIDVRNIMEATNSSLYHRQYPYKKKDELNLSPEEQVDLKRYNNRVKAFTFTAIGCGAISFISFALAEVNYRNYKTTIQYADGYRKMVQTYDFVAVTSLAAGIVSTGFAIYYGTLKRKILKTGRINVGIVSSEFGPAVSLNLKIK